MEYFSPAADQHLAEHADNFQSRLQDTAGEWMVVRYCSAGSNTHSTQALIALPCEKGDHQLLSTP